MKESLQQALQMFLDMLVSAKDFVIEQSPLVLRELLLLETITRGVWVGLGLLILLITISFTIYIKKHWHWYKGKDPQAGLAIMLPALGYVFSIPIILIHIIPLIKVIIAPRVYLIEYISNLIK